LFISPKSEHALQKLYFVVSLIEARSRIFQTKYLSDLLHYSMILNKKRTKKAATSTRNLWSSWSSLYVSIDRFCQVLRRVPCSMDWDFHIYSFKCFLLIHHRDWKIYPKVHLETQDTVNSQGNTQQKSNAGGITIPNIKVYYG
jgi:hypothetical protein